MKKIQFEETKLFCKMFCLKNVSLEKKFYMKRNFIFEKKNVQKIFLKKKTTVLFETGFIRYVPELMSSRMSLAPKTHFKVLGFDLGLEGQVLGLEASSPRKLPCPLLEDSTIF